jgi:hypothetical protein
MGARLAKIKEDLRGASPRISSAASQAAMAEQVRGAVFYSRTVSPPGPASRTAGSSNSGIRITFADG